MVLRHPDQRHLLRRGHGPDRSRKFGAVAGFRPVLGPGLFVLDAVAHGAALFQMAVEGISLDHIEFPLAGLIDGICAEFHIASVREKDRSLHPDRGPLVAVGDVGVQLADAFPGKARPAFPVPVPPDADALMARHQPVPVGDGHGQSLGIFHALARVQCYLAPGQYAGMVVQISLDVKIQLQGFKGDEYAHQLVLKPVLPFFLRGQLTAREHQHRQDDGCDPFHHASSSSSSSPLNFRMSPTSHCR